MTDEVPENPLTHWPRWAKFGLGVAILWAIESFAVWSIVLLFRSAAAFVALWFFAIYLNRVEIWPGREEPVHMAWVTEVAHG